LIVTDTETAVGRGLHLAGSQDDNRSRPIKAQAWHQVDHSIQFLRQINFSSEFV